MKTRIAFVLTVFNLLSSVVLGRSAENSTRRFESLSPQVGVFHDVVNVGVIQRHGKALLIGSGEGAILEAAQSLGIRSIDWVLYTDHLRDKCSGAQRLKTAGVNIAVPAGEAKFFRDATAIWQGADTILYDRMNFRPDLFVLRESVIPDRELRPGDNFPWEGLDIRVVPTPGPTDASVSFVVEVDSKRFAFTGDLIYGPGQLWNLYMLQKRFPGMTGDYWGWGGAASDLLRSLDEVLSIQPALLVPAHGMVMRNPADAVGKLKRNLHAVMVNYLTTAAWRIYFSGDFDDVDIKASPGPEFDVPMFPPRPLPQAPDWLHHATSTSWYIQAEDGTIFLLDCGFHPIVETLEQLRKHGKIMGVDGIWISHYHDDHVQSVNEVRRRYGAKVYAQAELRDILENPLAYSMPALCPESIHVDHTFAEGEVLNWKGYKLTGYYFPGQTIYHDGLLIEHGGNRIFMSGDSFANFGIDDYCSYNRNFLGDGPGYKQCFRLLLTVRPDMLVAAHWGPIPCPEEYLRKALDLLDERRKLLSALLPWDDPNFGLDPSWVRAYPYRQSVLPGQLVTVEARVYNHSALRRRVKVELHVPAGWQAQPSGGITISPQSEGRIRLKAVAPSNPSGGRAVLGLSVKWGDRSLGEIAEAVVDFLR